MTEDFNNNPSSTHEGEHAAAPGEQGAVNPTDPQAPTEDANIAARRRLLRAGLVAGPLLITLRGRPARAQLPSLGSAEIFYGAYVTQDQIDDPNLNFDAGDLGKPLNQNGEILDDETRRSGD